MKTSQKLTLSLAILSLALAAAHPIALRAAEPAAKPARPKLYDPSADGNKQITMALKTAQAENKRLILKFGAEW